MTLATLGVMLCLLHGQVIGPLLCSQDRDHCGGQSQEQGVDDGDRIQHGDIGHEDQEHHQKSNQMSMLGFHHSTNLS